MTRAISRADPLRVVGQDKHWNTQEVVIGGWRAGKSRRSSGDRVAAHGHPGPGGLQFAGRVGTGLLSSELANLKDAGAARRTSPPSTYRPRVT